MLCKFGIIFDVVYKDNHLSVSSVSIAATCGASLLDVRLQSTHVSTAGSHRLCRQIRSVYINPSWMYSY